MCGDVGPRKGVVGAKIVPLHDNVGDRRDRTGGGIIGTEGDKGVLECLSEGRMQRGHEGYLHVDGGFCNFLGIPTFSSSSSSGGRNNGTVSDLFLWEN